MGYNSERPADDDYISVGPGVIRENQESLKNGQIVNAGMLNGKSAGNASGQIAVSNGAKCENLNADKLDNKDADQFAAASHPHNVATANDDGFMSNTDKQKLNGVQAGAEVNQNSFGCVDVSNGQGGGIGVFAISKQDHLKLYPGANITLTADAVSRRITISISGKVPNASNADFAANASLLQGYSPSAFAAAGHIKHTGEANSKGVFNGYKKFADGIIIQWDVVSVNAGVALWVNWPIVFPNAIAVVIPTLQGSSPTHAPAACGTFKLNGGYLYNPNNDLNNISYIAIGW